MISNCNDGSQKEPYLRCDFNYWNLDDLPSFTSGPYQVSEEEKYQAIKNAGFEGVQDGDPALCSKFNLNLTAQLRVNQVGDLDEHLPVWLEKGYDCATVHVGWGMESDEEINCLLEYIFDASEINKFPIFVETHRATITQDMWRTVEIIKRFPEIRFNADFSHWYTGLEMVNGIWEDKLSFIQPVFDRVSFIHGRIGNPGSIQVDISDGKNLSYVEHFKEMWVKSFKGFLKNAQPGDFLPFTTELLPSQYFYARLVRDESGNLVEEGDRWQQAILLKDIAEECWRIAKSE